MVTTTNDKTVLSCRKHKTRCVDDYLCCVFFITHLSITSRM